MPQETTHLLDPGPSDYTSSTCGGDTTGMSSPQTQTHSTETHLLEVNSLAEYYDYIGIGKLQYLVFVASFVVGYIDYTEIYVLSILMPTLRCHFNLGENMETAIGFSVFGAYSVSCLVISKFADKYGRKKVFMVSACGLVVASLSASIFDNKWVFLFTRIIVGGCAGINYVTFLAYTVEVLPEKHRSVGNVLATIGSILSYVSLNVQALFFLHRIGWRWFLVLLSVPGAILLVFMLFLPESPRYLLVSGQIDKMKQVLGHLAKIRNKSLDGIFLNIKVETGIDERLGSVWEICATSYGKDFLLLSAFFSSNIYQDVGVMSYLPLALTSSIRPTIQANLRTCQTLKTTDFFNILGVAIAGLFGGLFAAFLQQRHKRLPCLRLSMGLTLVPAGLLYLRTNPNLTTASAAMVKFLNYFGNTIFWVYLPEYFPTYVRTTGMGFVNCIGKFGSALGAASVYKFFYTSHDLLISLLLLVILIGLIASLFLRVETLHLMLQDDSSNRDEPSTSKNSPSTCRNTSIARAPQ